MIADASALFDPTDDDRPLSRVGEALHDPFDGIHGHDQDHADAHVECAVHLVAFDRPPPGQLAKQDGNLPRTPVDHRAQALGEDARHVVREPAARDVGERVQVRVLEQSAQGAQVAAVRGEQGVSDRAGHAGQAVIDAELFLLEEDLLLYKQASRFFEIVFYQVL